VKFKIHSISELPADWLPLVQAARQVQSRAYAPYSGYQVASAIEDENNRVHVGVNVENANYSGTLCAERNASTRMIAEGGKRIRRVVVLTPTEDPNFPCGACLQALQEFQSDTEVVGVNQSVTLFSKAKLTDLFPAAFTADRLQRSKNP
jgi:cytidine deaminase